MSTTNIPTPPKPCLHFLKNGELDIAADNEQYRVLEFQGRRGLNTTSIDNKFTVPQHTTSADRGAVAIQVFSLEDLGSTTFLHFMAKHNAHCQNYNLLSDCPDIRQSYAATFAMGYSTARNPDLFAKFYYGDHSDACYDPQRAFVNNNFFDFEKNRWLQILLTWDKPQRKLRLYVNGVLCGAEDQSATELIYETVGEQLFCGNPSFCLRDIAFYDDVLNNEQAAAIFADSGIVAEDAYQDFLHQRYAGNQVPSLDWQADDSWELREELSLTDPAELERFYIQGNQDGEAPQITDDGLLVETYKARPGHRDNYKEGRRHIYLWLDRCFEGDISVEFDFNPLEENGLSLLLVHASGMQREDFMSDYPLRVNGVMSMVGWEDVRNYQWEFYRQMDDVRNDITSSAITKNPWQRKLGFGTHHQRMVCNQWHKAQFLKEGTRIRCILDGEVLCDVNDHPLQNNGPTLDFGRVALRAMCRTKILYKNLIIHTRNNSFKTVE